MKLCFLILAVGCVFSLSEVRADVSYAFIQDTNVIVTGIRTEDAGTGDVVLTSEYTTGATTSSGIYEGTLAGAVTGTWNVFNPVIAGETVTESTLYGPNTPLYDSNISAGNIIAVGSYKYAESPTGSNADHGVLYEGPVDGSGTFTQIDATPLQGSGTTVNTIAHSTMGNVVVGNYDTTTVTGKAFIYNMATGTWTDLNPQAGATVTGTSLSATAYGVWQDSANEYTIAGGYSDIDHTGVDAGYLVNYNSMTGALTDFTEVQYDDEPIGAFLSHIDGITATADGFNLTGDFFDVATGSAGGFFATIAQNPDGSFGDPVWTAVVVPGSDTTSGNTVDGTNALGIFVTGTGSQSYIATVGDPIPEPAGLALGAVGLAAVGLGMARRRVRRA